MTSRIKMETSILTQAYGRKGWVKNPDTRCNRADKRNRKRTVRRMTRRAANALVNAED